MSKNDQLIEVIIKVIYGVFAFLLAAHVLVDVVSMLPLFNLNGLDEMAIYAKAIATNVGEILYDAEPINDIDIRAIGKLIISFLMNVKIVPFIFAILTLVLAVLSFVFVKWKLPYSYLKLSLMIMVIYIVKYIFFGVIVFIFYEEASLSLEAGVIVANLLYILLSFIEIILAFLWTLKFVLNIRNDIDELISFEK